MKNLDERERLPFTACPWTCRRGRQLFRQLDSCSPWPQYLYCITRRL